MDIASLGIRIETQGATQATTQLNQLDAAGKKAETSVKTLQQSWEKAQFDSKKIHSANQALAGWRQGMAESAKASTQAAIAAERENGVRERLSKLLATERGQRVLEAQAARGAATAAAAGAKAYQQTAMSAKQLQMATRMLPMQFSDIAISLQAGQSPMQVLLQQGSQIKDSFGGAGVALRAVGGYVWGLVNPFTVAAAAVGGLALAYTQLEERQNAIDRSLILTGQYSLTTAEALRELSREMDQIGGVTAGSASRAIAEVAATGRFTADQLETVAVAAETWRVATGTAVEDTVKQFAKLRDDPVKAILDLNRTYHFLTESTYDQIKALQEQGRDVDAATFAIEAYANALTSRAPQMEAQVGAIAGAFRGLRRAASEAWDTAVEGMDGAFARMVQQFATHGPLLARFAALTTMGLRGTGGASNLPDFSNVTTSPIVDNDRVAADDAWQKNAIRYATEREKLERDIAEAKRLGAAAGKSQVEIDARIAAIQSEHARRNRSRAGGGAVDNAGFRAQIQSVQDALRLEQNAIQNANSVLQAQYSARLVTVENYYTEQRSLVQRAAAAEEEAIRQQIAILQTRTKTEKDAIDARREIGELETRLATVRADLTAKQAVLDIQEKANVERKTQALRAYTDALDRSAEALAAQMQSDVNRVFMSEREFEIQSRINDVYRERADRERELATQLANREITQGEYDDYLAALQAATDRSVEIVRKGYADMAAAQADWSNGAIKAIKDYADAAADVAGQTYDLFNNAFTGLEDLAVDFFTKGTADWRGFLDGIAAEITRFIVKQQLSGFFESMLGGASGGGGQGGWVNALWGLFGGGNAGWGWSEGGYTGDGGKREVAGLVHRGEYVIPADATRRLGRGLLDQIANGQVPGGSMSVQQTFVIQGKLDRATQDQLARQNGREVQKAMSRV